VIDTIAPCHCYGVVMTPSLLLGTAPLAALQAQNPRQAFDDYVRQTAEKGSTVDQLAKLADLKSKGVLTDTEFETEKARVLG
jgi:hypothetical protein